jgi:hypothetical protein
MSISEMLDDWDDIVDANLKSFTDTFCGIQPNFVVFSNVSWNSCEMLVSCITNDGNRVTYEFLLCEFKAWMKGIKDA